MLLVADESLRGVWRILFWDYEYLNDAASFHVNKVMNE